MTQRLTAACLMAAAILVSAAVTGCFQPETRLWADTATPDREPSMKHHQYAYDGEPVTFELQCPVGAAHYVIFGIGPDVTVINTPKAPGQFRWTHAFSCGLKSRDYEVYATPYLLRGHCDWVFDKDEDKWYFYPSRNDPPDVKSADERTMIITCYKVEVRFQFQARRGPPKRAELTLVRDDGKRSTIPPGQPAEGGAAKPGFLLLGPDAKGLCEVVYTPRWDEVSRAGQTRAELLVEYADGTLEQLAQDIDTP
jgi:hypothetical protein